MAPSTVSAAPPPPNTYATLISTFTSFLTISIHTLLSVRGIYPPTTFLTARAYNFPVHQSRHPAVCAWISAAVDAVRAELEKCTLARVALVIYAPASLDSSTETDTSDAAPSADAAAKDGYGKGETKILERYVFDTSRFPVVSKGEHDTPFANSAGSAASPFRVVDVEEQFRGCLARLSQLGTRLSPVEKGCSYTVAIELRDGRDPPVGHPQPWIPTEPRLQREKALDEMAEDEGDASEEEEPKEKKIGKDLGGVRTTPVRAVEAGEMVFEMWVEEGRAKVDMERGTKMDKG